MNFPAHSTSGTTTDATRAPVPRRGRPATLSVDQNIAARKAKRKYQYEQGKLRKIAKAKEDNDFNESHYVGCIALWNKMKSLGSFKRLQAVEKELEAIRTIILTLEGSMGTWNSGISMTSDGEQNQQTYLAGANFALVNYQHVQFLLATQSKLMETRAQLSASEEAEYMLSELGSFRPPDIVRLYYRKYVMSDIPKDVELEDYFKEAIQRSVKPGDLFAGRAITSQDAINIGSVPAFPVRADSLDLEASVPVESMGVTSPGPQRNDGGIIEEMDFDPLDPDMFFVPENSAAMRSPCEITSLTDRDIFQS
jgi:hypothetical protein